MEVDNNDADGRGPQQSDPGESGSPSQPPAGGKLRDKLQKLAEWRIDSTLIEFPEAGPEFRGGFATVSRAFLVSTSASKSSGDDSARTGGEKEPDGGTLKRKAIAVKKLKIESGKDKERVLGLALREAGFLIELSHENVIKLEGFVEDLSEDRVWLVFPWATNGNLKEFVASADWEIPERISLIYDVARGVEYLHSQNPPIYHGDLKSANVLVHSRAVITDFGSARRLALKKPPVQPARNENGAQPILLLETEFCEATNAMTLTGNKYTLRWAAPELLMDDEPGLWSDIWALGWIFYEVMTNSIPFQNVQKDSAVFIHVIQGNLPSVADHTGMPMIAPDRERAANTSGSRAGSVKLLMQLGHMHAYQNDYINASKFYTEALGICMETADGAGKADALFNLADVNRLQNNFSEAVKLNAEAVQIYTDIGNRQGRANALWGLAATHRSQKSYSEAVKFYSEVVQLCTEIGDKKGKADALFGLAEVHRLQNEYREAVTLYSEVVQICTDIGDRQGRADALWGLAEVHRLQKRYSQAVQLLSEALQIHTDMGERYGTAWDLMGLADVHSDQDQHEDAISLYEQATGILQEIGDTEDVAFASNRAALARQKLEPAEAE